MNKQDLHPSGVEFHAMEVWRVLTFSLPFVNLTVYLKDLAIVRHYEDSIGLPSASTSSFLPSALGSSCRFPSIKASEHCFYKSIYQI